MCTLDGLHQILIIGRKHNISVLYLIYFCHIRQWGHKGDLLGITPPTLLLLSCELLRCFGINPCGGLGMFQAIIEIWSVIVEKNKKTSDFNLFCVDLTLPWTWDDLVMTLGLNPCEIQPQLILPCILLGWVLSDVINLYWSLVKK